MNRTALDRRALRRGAEAAAVSALRREAEKTEKGRRAWYHPERPGREGSDGADPGRGPGLAEGPV